VTFPRQSISRAYSLPGHLQWLLSLAAATPDVGRSCRYDERLLRRLLFIRHARDVGFEVDDIRSLLDLAARPDQSCASVDAIAKAHLISTDSKIARLTTFRAEVHRMLKACAKGRIAQCKVIDVLAHHDRQSQGASR
jgi:DNA-binding transcriptional MerR regulator